MFCLWRKFRFVIATSISSFICSIYSYTSAWAVLIHSNAILFISTVSVSWVYPSLYTILIISSSIFIINRDTFTLTVSLGSSICYNYVSIIDSYAITVFTSYATTLYGLVGSSICYYFIFPSSFFNSSQVSSSIYDLNDNRTMFIFIILHYIYHLRSDVLKIEFVRFGYSSLGSNIRCIRFRPSN